MFVPLSTTRAFNNRPIIGVIMSDLQQLPEGLFAFAFDQGENFVFRLELRLTIGDDHLFTADHRNKDGTCWKG